MFLSRLKCVSAEQQQKQYLFKQHIWVKADWVFTCDLFGPCEIIWQEQQPQQPVCQHQAHLLLLHLLFYLEAVAPQHSADVHLLLFLLIRQFPLVANKLLCRRSSRWGRGGADPLVCSVIQTHLKVSIPGAWTGQMSIKQWLRLYLKQFQVFL